MLAKVSKRIRAAHWANHVWPQRWAKNPPGKKERRKKDVRGLCAAELTRALQETEHLLGEVSVMTRKQAPAVQQCASLLSSMEGVVGDEVSLLAR